MLSMKFKSSLLKGVISASILMGTMCANANVINKKNDLSGDVVNAVKLIKGKQYAKACSALNSIYDDKSLLEQTADAQQTQSNIYYLLGQCYAGLGLYEQSKEQLEKVVIASPLEPRPYLDLALINQYLGNFDAANEKFDALLAMNDLSPELREKIESITDKSPDAWNYYVNFFGGGLSDSNINNAPISDSITIYNQEFTFNSESRPIDATGVNLGLTAQVSKLLSKTSYISGQVELSSTTFGDFSKQNHTYVDLNISYNSKFWNGEYFVQPRFATVNIGGENFLNLFGVQGGYVTMLSDSLRMNANLGYHQYTYSDDSDRDISQIKPEVLLNYRLLDDLVLYSSVALSMGTASDDIYSYSDMILKVGTDYSLFDSLMLSLSYKMNSISYDGEIEGFGKVRDDGRTTINVNASYNLGGFSDFMKRATIDIGGSVYQNDSNIALFENDRTQFYVLFNIAL